jgi:hypothetical protein
MLIHPAKRAVATDEGGCRSERTMVAGRAVPDADVEAQRRVVDAFLAAAHDGDFHRLVLDG